MATTDTSPQANRLAAIFYFSSPYPPPAPRAYPAAAALRRSPQIPPRSQSALRKIASLAQTHLQIFSFFLQFFHRKFPHFERNPLFGVFRAISVQFAQKLLFEKYEFFLLRYLQIQRRACIMFLTKNIGFPLPI